eukprot:3344372-Karenia_brevis.AAC.1
MEGRIRSILISLEERLSREVDAKERIVAFRPASAAFSYNRLHRGDDGKVRYERINLASNFLYRRHGGAKLEKIKAKFEYGILVGANRRSNEFLVADEEGVRRA